MKNKYLKKASMLIPALLLGFMGFAQPANDNCAGAIALTIAADVTACTPTTANTTSATTESYTSGCWSSSYDDGVWYSFTAINDTVYLSVSNKSVAGTVGYSIFSGSCAGAELVCGTDATPVITITGLTVSTNYFISIFYQGTTNRGTFDICLGNSYPPPPPPANDDCGAGVISITTASSQASCVGTTVNNLGATNSTPAPSCFTPPNGDQWYSFIATSTNESVSSGNWTGSIGGVGFDLYSGTCGTLTEVPASCGVTSFTGLTIGTTYYLQTFAFGTGTYDICVYDTPPPPVNDDCGAGVISITTASGPSACVGTTVNNFGATNSTPAPSCATPPNGDQWYSFVATSANESVTAPFASWTGSIAGVGFDLYSGTCGTLAEVPASCGFSTVVNFTGLTIGNTYYLQTFAAGSGTYDICVYDTPPPPTPPVNDDCLGAITLPVSTSVSACSPTTANTTGATAESYTSGCWSVSYDDGVWYSFTATSTSKVFLTISNQSDVTNVGYSVFTGSCAGSELTCATYTASDSIGGLTPGTVYYVNVFYTGTAVRGTFDVCVSENLLTGIAQIDLEKSLKVYPNPATTDLTVKFNIDKVNKLSVKLQTIDGRVVYADQRTGFAGDYNQTIATDNLSKGVYMLQIISDNATINKKVIIQ